ncbi:GFA family protein [Novosphingobium sp. BW1]|uniref:GFA family protein n=1 Tax=Novosphingobium sp. BW1 TaxID=2592621 RepID=UPI0011DE9D0A|nr:GFA family protein [Novosphingobium sp. BW1]TYC86901.1 GFA family protein [Novosphingobium sp. BW1]
MLKTNREYGGGCLCGAIRYRVTGPSLFETQCCCRDCQKATGTGHTTIVGIPRDQLQIEGEPAVYISFGESGGAVSRHFCGTCGGRIFTSGALPGENVMVQAGSLDEPGEVTPENVIYGKDALPWDHFDPDLEVYALYPPFDPVTHELT